MAEGKFLRERDTFLQLSKTLISHGDHVAESRNKRDLKRVLYEICDNVLRGSLKADQVLPSLAELAEIEEDVPSLLADVFCILGMSLVLLSHNSIDSKFWVGRRKEVLTCRNEYE